MVDIFDCEAIAEKHCFNAGDRGKRELCVFTGACLTTYCAEIDIP